MKKIFMKREGNVMKRMKTALHWKQFLLGAILVIVLALGYGENAFAITQADADASPVLTLNKWKSDKLTECKQQKWYRFDVKQSGKFRIFFKANANADSDMIHAGWHYQIYKKGELTSAVREYGSIKNTNNSEWLAFAQGTFYVKVYAQDSYNDGYAPTNCPFDIKVEFQQSNVWEKENNDTNLTANTISTNTKYYGNMYWCNDVDWYKYTITKDGYHTVTLGPDANDCDSSYINHGWKFIIYEGDAITEVRPYFSIKSSQTSAKFPMKKGTYYIKIMAQDGYDDGYAPSEQVYNFSINEVAEANWESEHNDEQINANTIKTGSAYKGTTYWCNDADWSKFTVSSRGTVKITLKLSDNVNVNNVHKGWRFDLYSKSGNTPILSKESITVSGTETKIISAGTYYLRIYPQAGYDDGYAPSSCEYNFKVAFTPDSAKAKQVKKSTVKLKSVTAGKKKATVKWKKNKYADGYEIYRSTKSKKGYAKVGTVSSKKLTYTNKKLKAKKVYYYKVRAFKKINGKKVYSKFSNPKKVKTKK